MNNKTQGLNLKKVLSRNQSLENEQRPKEPVHKPRDFMDGDDVEMVIIN